MAPRQFGIVAMLLSVAVPCQAQLMPTLETDAVSASDNMLAPLFAQWRRFAVPPIRNGSPDYGAAAMARQASALPAWQQRLQAVDRSRWSQAALTDWQLVQAEMNGMDFDHRVLRPWARDPTFYASVFADTSDVPLHEGPYAEPHIDLWKFSWPLTPADDRTLTLLLAAVPANLAAAKRNLKGSDAADLWRYGHQAFEEQSATLGKLAAGTLVMNTLDGRKPANIEGASAALGRAAADAKIATDDFAAWIKAEAPGKSGPTGVGKENYDWYVKNVELLPWGWDVQVALLTRELDRSIAALRLEEVRNRDLPPIIPLADPVAYQALVDAKAVRFSRFLANTGLIPDAPWARTAIANQQIDYLPPEKRNFFSHVTARDPLPLQSHFTHWIDLARMRESPHASPIRREAPLYTIYSNRSEGFATAFEEIVMQAGLYDDVPHGRELVYIMLANRAARGLASLRVQANEMTLAEAGKFHAAWTPRGWSDPASPLVGFEQLLYARQPGYGPSYVTGKLQLDHLLAAASHADDMAGRPFVMRDVMRQVMDAGIIPVALIEREVVTPK